MRFVTPWVRLLLVVLLAYVVLWGWDADETFSAAQVGGLVVVVVAAMVVAVRAGLRPRHAASTAFWTLLVANGLDLFLLAPGGDANLWPVSAVFFGPFVWAAFYVPALLIEERHPRWMTMVPPPPVVTVAERPDLDAQVATWRRYRDRTA